jgi:hypothetical protein
MNDPIVAEVRKFRTEHARRFDFDLHAICADIRQFEAVCGHKVIQLPAKRLVGGRLQSGARGADENLAGVLPS